MNEKRCTRFEKAIRDYLENDDMDDILTDILTDARHWCQKNGIGFEDAVLRSFDHFYYEQED